MRGYRIGLILCVLILLFVGLLMIFSSSEPDCGSGDLFQFVKKQGIAIGFGLVAASFLYFFDYHYWKKPLAWSVLFYLVIVAMLIMPIVIGKGVNGSKRWIELGSFSFQPSELAKFGIVLLTSVYITLRGWKLNLFWKGFFPWMIGMAVPALLIAVEPDYGAAAIFAALGLLVMFVGGCRYKYLIPLAAFAIAFLVIWVTCVDENRMRRIREATQDDSYSHQQNAALVAIQDGGIKGVGYNESAQKWGYLPEAHTDYIFSIGAEEFGLFFTIPVISLFLMILFFGMKIAYNAPDKMGRMIAYGMTVLVVGQAGFNFCVIAGWGLSKGIALPFISYGGSNVIIALMSIGMVLNVSRQKILQNPRLKSKILRHNFKKGGR